MTSGSQWEGWVEVARRRLKILGFGRSQMRLPTLEIDHLSVRNQKNSACGGLLTYPKFYNGVSVIKFPKIYNCVSVIKNQKMFVQISVSNQISHLKVALPTARQELRNTLKNECALTVPSSLFMRH